jgi:hypothetical protein
MNLQQAPVIPAMNTNYWARKVSEPIEGTSMASIILSLTLDVTAGSLYRYQLQPKCADCDITSNSGEGEYPRYICDPINITLRLSTENVRVSQRNLQTVH